MINCGTRSLPYACQDANLLPGKEVAMNYPENGPPRQRISQADFDFVKNMELFKAIPQNARRLLFTSLERLKVPQGTRFIAQGEMGDSFFIIRNGSCAVNLEKGGTVRQLAILGPGEVVGEMAVLTGENRNSHVDAQTDMELWRVSRKDFDSICSEHGELRHFLTEILTKRLEGASIASARTIGKYTLQEVVGTGGWAIVYRGVHSTLDLSVAIKMLKHRLAMDASFMRQFEREAKVIANLNHENIVKVYDIERLYRTVFIVMEYIEGVTLEKLLVGSAKLPPAKSLNILLQLCAGLGYAHGKGIVHRDIKPANIMIQGDKKARILDFGLAGPPGALSGYVVEGTPLFMPPEVIRQDKVDARSDIYSLGMVCYRMMTGKIAFRGPDASAIFRQHLHSELPDPRSANPELPDELCKFLVRATQKDPAARYQSANDIVEELHDLAGSLGVTTPDQAPQRSHTTTLLVSYRDEHKEIVNRFLKDVSRELEKIGAVMRQADFKDMGCD
jgi:eukaryotic-like serine/threonine-protein kinase